MLGMSRPVSNACSLGEAMAYFPDLSPYSYSPSVQEMLNIGWLAREHPYNTGDAPDGLLTSLVSMAHDPINMQRGMHFCELCPEFQTARSNTSRGHLFLGSGEIRVAGRRRITYVSPVMIIHYIEQRDYLPPAEFCAAALASAQ